MHDFKPVMIIPSLELGSAAADLQETPLMQVIIILQ